MVSERKFEFLKNFTISDNDEKKPVGALLKYEFISGRWI